MTMLTMYDSIDISAMPKDGDIYAGYTDGKWATFSQLAAAFPGKRYVSITVFGKDSNGNFVDAMVCDREDGDMDPADAAAWAKWKVSIGHRPTIYCNLAAHPDVVTALAAVELAFVTDVDWWEADYDNVAELTPGSVAKQYQSTTDPDLDTSIVDPSWLGDAPTPPAPPTPTEDSMASAPISFKPGQTDIFQCNGIWYHKWLDAAGAHNEDVLANNDSGKPITGVTFPPQTPQMAVVGGQLVGTAEDSNKMVWYIAQGPNDGSWGVEQLP